VLENPRFTASGLEFGSLAATRPGSPSWHYVAATLPAPLPRLVLDAVSNNASRSDLPPGFEQLQRISLDGGAFDRAFVTYAPVDTRADTLYVLSPEVMADLVKFAGDYNVEIVDNTVVFFTSSPTDFTDERPWNAVNTLINTVIPRLVEKTQRYVDERLPRPHRSLLPTALGSAAARPLDEPDARPATQGPLGSARVPLIARSGRRVVTQKRRRRLASFVLDLGGFTAYVVAYFAPAVLIFAAFLSITDGRPSS
jgi:hypothetical protein